MSFIKTMKMCCVACLSMMTGVAFADGSWGVQDSFEGGLPVSLPAHWSGDAEIQLNDSTYPAEPAFGYPIPTATHLNALQIEGKAICTNQSAATAVKAAQVDFLVKVVAPDEEPDVSTETEGAQIALAAWTNGLDTVNKSSDTVPLKLFCMPRGDGVTVPQWVTLTNGVVTGTWVRVGLVFDYATKLCRVTLDGLPVMSANGFRKNIKNESDLDGSWYQLANDPAEGIGDRVSEMKIIGTTQIDDFVITNTSIEEYNPYIDPQGKEITQDVVAEGGRSVAVPLNMIDKSGLSVAEIAAGGKAEGDTLTVLDIAEAGLEVGKGQVFELKTITPAVPTGTGDGKTQQFTLTFPGRATDGRYTIEVYKSDTYTDDNKLTVSDDTISGESGTKTWSGTVPVGNNKVIYFRLKATQPTVKQEQPESEES